MLTQFGLELSLNSSPNKALNETLFKKRKTLINLLPSVEINTLKYVYLKKFSLQEDIVEALRVLLQGLSVETDGFDGQDWPVTYSTQ